MIKLFIEAKPFPYLRQDQYAGRGNGEIVFLDKSIPDNEKDRLRKEYKKWWEERLKEKIQSEWQ